MIVAVVVASLFEIVPTFLIRSNVPTIASVKPYTPLELAGRDIYIAEGCYNCHSQMIRPIRPETKRYGEYSKPGEFVYDHPFQWGSPPHRSGPGARGRQASTTSGTCGTWRIPRAIDAAVDHAAPIRWLLSNPLDFDGIQRKVDAMAMLGVPYGEAVDAARPQMARRAGPHDRRPASRRRAGRRTSSDKEIIALVAYLQRLGHRHQRRRRPATPPGPGAPLRCDSPTS